MIRSNRKSVKTLWPVFLLSFALALPGQLTASPGPDQGRRAQVSQKHKEKKVKKQKRQVRQQVRKQTVVETRAARRPARRAAPAPRTVVHRREVVHRHEPAWVEPVQYRNRRGRGGADPTIAHIDGYLTGEGYRCQTLRDHDGRIYGLVGNLDSLREGDHVRLEGRFTDSSICRQGVAFDVYKVQTVWADRQHRSTLYDHLYDGPFERHGGSYGRYDRYGRDPYDDGRYSRDRYRDRHDRYDR